MKLLEEILNQNNLNKAYKKVVSNKGVAGVDGITVDEEFDYLKENKNRIINQIRKRRYKPQPVKRVQIPKEIWKQWKKITKRQKALEKLGVNKEIAHNLACTRKGYQLICKTDWIKFAINNERLRKRGLVFLLDQYEKVHI